MASARLGMPGDRENVVKLTADHSTVCKFGSSQDDRDNLELVQSNIGDLYDAALKKSESLPPLTLVKMLQESRWDSDEVDATLQGYTRARPKPVFHNST